MLLSKVRLQEKTTVIIVRNKADLHAFFFICRLELAMTSYVASIVLGLIAQGKHRASQLFLPQREQEIALVFARVTSALEQRASAIRTFLQPREMAGGDVLCAELVGALNEPSKFQILIAHDARIGSAAGLVFVGKVLNDFRLEFRRFVDEIIRDAKLITDRARIGNCLRPATFVFGPRNAILWPELEGNAHNIVTLLEQKGG